MLRKWLETGLTDSRPYHHKMGFTVPVRDWIAVKGKRVGALLAGQPCIQGAFAPDAASSLFGDLGARGDQKRGSAAWIILFYPLWHIHHLDRRRMGGDVFDVLGFR